MKVIGRLLVSALGFSVGIGLASAALAYALEIRWGVGPASGGATSDNGSAGKELYIAKGGGGGGGAGGAGGGAGGGGGAAGGAGGAGAAGGAGSGAAAGAAGSGGAGAAGSGAGAASGGAAGGVGSGAGPAGVGGGAGTAGAGAGGPGAAGAGIGSGAPGSGGSPGGPEAATGSGSPSSQGGADVVAILDLARADLAAGAFVQAQARAEGVLRALVPASVRATALVLAGDAAYALGAYRTAANRYREAVRADQLPAEAAHTGFALGWTALRLGRRDQAQYTWGQVAQQFPADPGAPLALIQAAELAAQADDLASAQQRLDQVLEGYPTAPEAEIARLSRSIVALRAGRTQEAVRDLRTLALSGRPSLPQERRMLLDRLTPAGAFAGPERQLLITNQYDGGRTVAAGPAAAHESDTARSDTAEALERFAAPFLDGAGDPETTPRVLHGLVFAAAEDKAWPVVQRLSSRLVDRFPGYPAAPDVLFSVAARATSAQQWPIVRSSYEHVLVLNRSAALTPPAQLNFAEALFRTDAPAQARGQLSRFLEVAPRAEDAPRALHLLAEVDEALDRPAEALAAYERLRRDYPPAEWTTESLLPHARLLQHAVGRQQEARALLEEAVQRTQGEALTEASFRLAQLSAANGEHQHAVDWYMSAAYGTGQSSRWYRPALLGAGRSLAALHRTLAAEAVYRNLLPSAPLGPVPRDGRPVEGLREKVEDPELAAEAASGIAELRQGAGRNAEAVDMYLTAASLAPKSDQAWRGLVGAIRSLVAIRDWKSAAAIYQRLVESHGNTPEILAEARNALGPPRRDTSRPGR